MIVEDFLRYMQAEREASPRTVETYRMALDNYTAFLKDCCDNMKTEDADSDIVRNWIEDMMEHGYKPATILKQLSAVKSLYRYALRKGIITKDPANNVTGPKKEKTLPAFIKEAEANRLFDELPWKYDNIKDVRARTLLLLLYSTGIRRAEVVALRDKDINLVNSEMKVTGKRRKQRVIPLTRETLDAVKLYMEMRDRETPKTEDTEEFFVNDKGKGMTPNAVYYIVKHYLSLVTTQKKRSPHVLRHSFATAMLNHDAKLGSVQKLLGHESIMTTEIYTHVTFEELKRTYTKAHPRAEGEDDNN